MYYDHWGYPYAYAGPYAYPLWWTPGLYCGWYPASVATCAAGAWGGCVAGACGGGVGAGACGGPGVSFVFSPLFLSVWRDVGGVWGPKKKRERKKGCLVALTSSILQGCGGSGAGGSGHGACRYSHDSISALPISDMSRSRWWRGRRQRRWLRWRRRRRMRFLNRRGGHAALNS